MPSLACRQATSACLPAPISSAFRCYSSRSGAPSTVGARAASCCCFGMAVLACAAFALARSLASLLAARALIGVGVSACLMAPLTAYRQRFGAAAQLRANSWMLMTGSLGMVASTLPVQWLLPVIGWRGLFWAVAGLLALAMLLIAIVVPRDAASVTGSAGAAPAMGYKAIFRHAYFLRLAPLAFFVYGGMIAVQSLWAGPWLTNVAGWSAAAAAAGLFAINLSMLVTFFGWGVAMPQLVSRGWKVDRLIALGVPFHCCCCVAQWRWVLSQVRRVGRLGASPLPLSRSVNRPWHRPFLLPWRGAHCRRSIWSSFSACFACNGALACPSMHSARWVGHEWLPSELPSVCLRYRVCCLMPGFCGVAASIPQH